jgi:hypothetical protein
MCARTSSSALNQSNEFYKQKLTIGSKLGALMRATCIAPDTGTDHAALYGSVDGDSERSGKNSPDYEQKKFLVLHSK